MAQGLSKCWQFLFNFFYNFKFSFWLLFFEVKGRHLHLFEKNIYTRFVDAAHARGQICRFFGIELIKIYLIENLKKMQNHSTLCWPLDLIENVKQCTKKDAAFIVVRPVSRRHWAWFEPWCPLTSVQPAASAAWRPRRQSALRSSPRLTSSVSYT